MLLHLWDECRRKIGTGLSNRSRQCDNIFTRIHRRPCRYSGLSDSRSRAVPDFEWYAYMAAAPLAFSILRARPLLQRSSRVVLLMVLPLARASSAAAKSSMINMALTSS